MADTTKGDSASDKNPVLVEVRLRKSILNYVIVILIVIIGMLLNNSRTIPDSVQVESETVAHHSTESPSNAKPTYMLYNANGKKEHLIHVETVLQRFGYDPVDFNAEETNWTLMWAHDYPFNKLSTIDFKNLRPCQWVNHIPGCGYITNKVDLSTTKIKYIPRAFKMPDQERELLEYADSNPDKLFVHKHNQHRHIRVRKLSEIDFGNQDNFVQEFVDNPLLIDGFKFDIGVYTVITSIDPLRAYYYKGDILFRFCPVAYHPFDPDNVDKYIVGDDYLPIWQVPSLSTYYNDLKHGMRDSFDLYMEAAGRDPKRIWNQVEESIRLMLLNKEQSLVDVLRRYKSKRNFFELMRIDFVVDNDLNVFMMEANMSPNLSSAHFPKNQLLYEQVLYNTLKMLGVAFPQQNGTCSGNPEINRMMSTDKNIVTNAEICSRLPCKESCAPVSCGLCYNCLTDDQKRSFNDAVSEQLNRGDMKRICPPTGTVLSDMSDEYWGNLSSENQFMARWYHSKCTSDPDYC